MPSLHSLITWCVCALWERGDVRQPFAYSPPHVINQAPAVSRGTAVWVQDHPHALMKVCGRTYRPRSGHQ